MITKRGFLRGASAAAFAATAPRGSWAASTTGASRSEDNLQGAPASPPLDVVVFNDRYSDARTFAEALGERGVPTLAMAGDAGTLWHGTLAKEVAAGRGRLAGIGTSMDLLILESLGREAGLRVRFLAHHDCRGSRTLTHVIAAKHAHLAHATLTSELSGPDWPVRLAALFPGVAEHARVREPAGNGVDLRIVTTATRSDDHPGMLFSWILADDPCRQEPS